MEEEIWKPLVGLEDFYQISNQGNIKKESGKLCKTNISKYGYKKITLYNKDNKTKKTINIHRAVAEAFIGISDLVVDHINDIKTDNRLINLQYISISKNVRKHFSSAARVEGLPMGVYKTTSKRYSARIFKDKVYYFLGTFDTIEEAEFAYKQKIFLLEKQQ